MDRDTLLATLRSQVTARYAGGSWPEPGHVSSDEPTPEDLNYRVTDTGSSRAGRATAPVVHGVAW